MLDRPAHRKIKTAMVAKNVVIEEALLPGKVLLWESNVGRALQANIVSLLAADSSAAVTDSIDSLDRDRVLEMTPLLLLLIYYPTSNPPFGPMFIGLKPTW